MAIVDLILIIAVLGFIVSGFFSGFIHTLGNILGTLIGIFVSARLTGPIAEFIGAGGNGLMTIIIFIILFLLVSRLVGLFVWLGEKFFGWFKWIPFAKLADRLLGAALGLIEGVIIVSIVLFYAVQILPDAALKVALENSAITQALLESLTLLQLLFPADLRIAFGG